MIKQISIYSNGLLGQFTIQSKTKTKWCHNPISGHWWPENIPIKGFEVSGGRMGTTSHRTLEAAEKEVVVRTSLLEKIHGARQTVPVLETSAGT